MTRQTKITIQTDSVLLLRGHSSTRARCPMCNADSEMVAIENLRIVSNLDGPGVEEWLNSGGLHRLQGQDGATLVCLNSLLAHIGFTSTQ